MSSWWLSATRAGRTWLVRLAVVSLLAGIVAADPAVGAEPESGLESTAVEGGEVLIPAPVRSLPICQTIPDPDIGACPKKDSMLTISTDGSLDGSGTATVRISPTVGACGFWDVPTDTFSPSPCYSAVDIAPDSIFGCVYLDDSTGLLEDCPGLYRVVPDGSLGQEITRESTWRRNSLYGSGPWASCRVASAYRTYSYGGPTNLDPSLDFRWSSVGPTALDCQLRLPYGDPDNLMGASWLVVGARIEVKRSGTNGVVTTNTVTTFLPINGFLGPDAPPPGPITPPVDPNVPGVVGDDPNVPGTPPEPVGPFTDIPAGSFARADIKLIYDLGVTQGIAPDSYGPRNLVTREQMAAFLARLWRVLGNACPGDPSPFTDMGGSFATEDAACLYALGITTGTSSTMFTPAGFVTREQMAAFLARFWRALGNECEEVTTPFTDVPTTSFAYDDVTCIYRLQITNGTSAATYSPDDFVTREQMAAFLARLYRKVGDLDP